MCIHCESTTQLIITNEWSLMPEFNKDLQYMYVLWPLVYSDYDIKIDKFVVILWVMKPAIRC